MATTKTAVDPATYGGPHGPHGRQGTKDRPPIHVGDRGAMDALMERVAKRVGEECAEGVRLGIIDEKGNLLKKPDADDPHSPSGNFGGWG